MREDLTRLARALEARRRRPPYRELVVVALFVACIVVDELAPRSSAPRDVGFAFFAFLWQAVIAIGQWLAGVAVTTAVTVAQAAWMVAQAIVRFGRLVGGVFVKVYGFLGDFWTHALKPFVSWSWRYIQKLHAWLERVTKPLVDFLERVRKYVDQIYGKWLKPIVDTIEATRRVFQLLALAHVPFAREIDAKLAALERRLVEPLRYIYARLNEAMNWINRIVTLDGYFQRLTMIASLMRYQVDALKVWWTSIHKPLEGAKLAEYHKPLETKKIDQATSEARAYLERGGGPDQARIDEHAADLELRLRASGSIH